MKVAYIYDETIGLHSYGQDHPMNPFRITMTHSLVKSFGVDKHMDLYIPATATMTYHPQSYIDGIGSIGTPDCPIFENMQDFCVRSASASINGAQLICAGAHKHVINWAGGLHHAHKNEASGFCFTNDIVMAIRELLKTFERVMYIDIDVHHGDGVEEAFYHEDRVLTCSFHKHGEGYFPDTGTLVTTRNRAVNIPLQNGIDDASYRYIYEPIISTSIEKFRPNVIVFQAGADSLGEDRLGVFNLSIKGHADCLRLVKLSGLPVLLLGGGGYRIHNVSRCWAYETAVMCDLDPPSRIPNDNPFYEHFAPDYDTNPEFFMKYTNQNKKKYLDSVMGFVLEKISQF